MASKAQATVTTGAAIPVLLLETRSSITPTLAA